MAWVGPGQANAKPKAVEANVARLVAVALADGARDAARRATPSMRIDRAMGLRLMAGC